MLTKKQISKAVQSYARRHNHYVSTVRTMKVLFRAALVEYEKQNR